MKPLYRRKVWYSDPHSLDPSWAPPQFLNRKIYGDSNGRYGDEVWGRENALFWRYADFHRFERIDVVTKRREKILQRPWIRGEEWYREAERAVIADSKTRKNWCSWMGFWDDAEIFKRISYSEKLKVLQRMEKDSETGSGTIVRLLGTGDLAGWLVRQGQLFLRWKYNLPPRATSTRLRPIKRKVGSAIPDRMGYHFDKMIGDFKMMTKRQR